MSRSLPFPALLCLSLAGCHSSPGTAHATPEGLVRAYIQAQEATMQATAGEPQIQAMLAFLADSLVYEHPRAHATITGREAYADGLRRFLGTTQHAQIRVLRTLVNGSVVVTEQQLTFEVRRDGAWAPDGRIQVTVFDVANGRIARILDFWQPRQ